MPTFAGSSDSFYSLSLYSDVFKEVETDLSFAASNVTVNLWTPAVGKKFILKGCNLRMVVTTVYAGATVGAMALLCDNTIATRVIACIGVVGNAAEAVGKDYGVFQEDFREGIISAANDNTLRVIFSATATSGITAIRGTVWGQEV